MPSASDRMATTVTNGVRNRVRNARRRLRMPGWTAQLRRRFAIPLGARGRRRARRGDDGEAERRARDVEGEWVRTGTVTVREYHDAQRIVGHVQLRGGEAVDAAV